MTPIGYAVHWTKPTLDQAHPVFFKRCQRDEIKPYKYWLDEDQLEAAAEETPVAMEQPTDLITRSLSMDDPDDRVRMIFGLTSDDALPAANEGTQRRFFDYLEARLSFPFKADYVAASVLGSDASETVQILGFADPPLDRKEGIVCEARKGKDEFGVPLCNVHVHEDDPNFRHVEDYTYWLCYVNQKLDVVPEQFSESIEYTSLPPQTRGKVRDALYENRELIGQFVEENPAGLSPDELEIVASWKHALVGRFYIFRYLKKYTIFLSASDGPYKAYGVLGLADPIEQVVGPNLPVLCNAVLLPFNGQIIYDGLIAPYSITFGGGVRRHLKEDYNRAKEAFGIITSLGGQPAARHDRPKKIRRKPTETRSRAGRRSKSGEAKAIAEELADMTDSFCKEFLNEEYAELCRKLAEKLARKRPSPLLRGTPPAWASGIVRTIGSVNFLDDSSQSPHMKLRAIDEAFGVSQSTGQAKSREIRKALGIRQFDPEWWLPSRMEDNPIVWMLEVNGFVMDIRTCPRELQEAAFEKGLIPYIPGDRGEES